MNDRTEVYVAIIAVATLAIAIAQIGFVVVAGLAARRLARLAETVERDLKPVFNHLDAIGRDASRAAMLATAQVEKADRLVSDVVVRVEQVVASLQNSLDLPAREARALASAFKAAFDSLRDGRRNGRTQRSGEDEDVLFI